MENLLFILFLALLAGVYVFMEFSELRRASKRNRQFVDKLERAILKSQPTWDQALQIASTLGKTPNDVYRCSRYWLADILSGDNRDLVPHQALLESYIAKHQRAEPFEGLPVDVRVQLERLRDLLPEREHLFDPLSQKIRDLVEMHSAERRSQRRYTVWGFALGVVGALFAAYAYFFPYVAK